MDPRETLDRLMPGNLQLLQAREGYRYSVDAVLLARFARVKKGGRIADLGTGTGVLPLLLAHLTDAPVIYGIELQEDLARRADRNVILNGLQDRIRILQGDIRQIAGMLPAGAADLVVTNPPYRAPGSGRIAPVGERAAARHELAGSVADFIAAAGWLLQPGGRLAVIYLAERLTLLLTSMSVTGIEPKRLRLVHSRAAADARLVLVEGCKGARAGLQVEKPLILHGDGAAADKYSAEVTRMYGLEREDED
jgi:tRNA1Val (adenine37-N6)-methyltransferase